MLKKKQYSNVLTLWSHTFLLTVFVSLQVVCATQNQYEELWELFNTLAVVPAHSGGSWIEASEAWHAPQTGDRCEMGLVTIIFFAIATCSNYECAKQLQG